MAQEPSPRTRERILATAMCLFSEHGFAATSMRRLTREAKVNLASVHYHFGSKEGLIQAVFESMVGPVNRARITRLDAAVAAAADGPVPVEAIVEAFVAPALELARDPSRGRAIGPLLGRVYAEPGDTLRPIFERQFGEVVRRFGEALAAALPSLSLTELRWRMHFLVGAMAHTIADRHGLGVLCGGADLDADPDDVRRRLVAFVSAGLRAPQSSDGGGAP